jgi:hypothetical protein
VALNETIAVGVLLAALVAGLLAFAPGISESLIRSRVRRLPRMPAGVRFLLFGRPTNPFKRKQTQTVVAAEA